MPKNHRNRITSLIATVALAAEKRTACEAQPSAIK